MTYVLGEDVFEWAYRTVSAEVDRVEVGPLLHAELRARAQLPLRPGQAYTLLGKRLAETDELGAYGWRTYDWAGFVIAEHRTTG